jgi:hypothetical protein
LQSEKTVVVREEEEFIAQNPETCFEDDELSQRIEKYACDIVDSD